MQAGGAPARLDFGKRGSDFRPAHVPAMRWPARRKHPLRIRLRSSRSWRGWQLDFKKVVCKRGFRPGSIDLRPTHHHAILPPCMSLKCVWSGAMRRAFARNYGYFSAPLQNSCPICSASPAFPPAARQASSVDALGNTFALLAHLARPRRWARGPLWHPKA